MPGGGGGIDGDGESGGAVGGGGGGADGGKSKRSGDTTSSDVAPHICEPSTASSDEQVVWQCRSGAAPSADGIVSAARHVQTSPAAANPTAEAAWRAQ